MGPNSIRWAVRQYLGSLLASSPIPQCALGSEYYNFASTITLPFDEFCCTFTTKHTNDASMFVVVSFCILEANHVFVLGALALRIDRCSSEATSGQDVHAVAGLQHSFQVSPRCSPSWQVTPKCPHA